MIKRLFAILIVLCSAASVSAMDGEVAGKIGKIDKPSAEIAVNTGDNGDQIKMGDKLYVRIDGIPVIMKATFPMLTLVKCRLDNEYKNRLKDLKQGMTVYKYKPGILNSAETGTDKAHPSLYHNTIWKIIAPGGDPALYYVIFKPDGKLGYSYKDIENLQVDDTDSWNVENDELVITWTNGYSIEKFQIVPEERIFSGKKISKNFTGEKDCTIEKVKPD